MSQDGAAAALEAVAAQLAKAKAEIVAAAVARLSFVQASGSFPSAVYVSGIPGDTRLLVARQSGQVYAGSTLILDLSLKLEFAGERGLLGIAFDPAFTTNRFIYAHYSRVGDGATIIARYHWDTAAEKIILVVQQPASNHNGGTIAFGPDGYLYIALGDGGGADDTFGNGQNLNTLLGKILRIDVNTSGPYVVPASNPFAGGGARPETWAYGLRNPWRCSFDRQTGQLWCGDVGQNRVEEIDIIERGANYGWPRFEGTELYRPGVPLVGAPHTPPVYEYRHPLGVSVIGGYVYRGDISGLNGAYIYGDFAGSVWVLSGQTNTKVATIPGLTSFGEDNAGEIYAVSQSGKVYRLDS